MTEYRELLKDSRWQDKRYQILERADYACESCGSRYALQIHHVRYVHGRQPWDYMNSELRCLCSDCHETAHGLRIDFPKAIPQGRDIKYAVHEVMAKIAAQNGFDISDLD